MGKLALNCLQLFSSNGQPLLYS